MNTVQSRLLALILFPLVIGLSAPSQAEEPNLDTELSTVHVQMTKAAMLMNLRIYINDLSIGTLENENNYFTIQVAPGKHKVRTNMDYGGMDGLMAIFDLELQAGSEVLLECHSHQGMIRRKVPKDPVLQEWHSYCPSGDVTTTKGVATCVKPYREHNHKKLFKSYASERDYMLSEPGAGCYLAENLDGLADGMPIKPLIDFVASDTYLFALAERQNSIEAYRRVVDLFPDSGSAVQARSRIEELNAQEAYKAQEQKIQAAMQRDASLPIEIRKDKYILSLTNHLNNRQFEDALFYIELLDRLNVELSPSFEYFWGEALFETGRPEEAISKLYSYVSKVGSTGQYYAQALQLSTQAETRIAELAE